MFSFREKVYSPLDQSHDGSRYGGLCGIKRSSDMMLYDNNDSIKRIRKYQLLLAGNLVLCVLMISFSFTFSCLHENDNFARTRNSLFKATNVYYRLLPSTIFWNNSLTLYSTPPWPCRGSHFHSRCQQNPSQHTHTIPSITLKWTQHGSD